MVHCVYENCAHAHLRTPLMQRMYKDVASTDRTTYVRVFAVLREHR